MQVRCSINDLVILTQAGREFQRKYAGHVHSQVRAKERNLATASLLRDNRIYVACQIPMIFPTYSLAPVRTISWWYRLWPCRLLQRHRSHSTLARGGKLARHWRKKFWAIIPNDSTDYE